MSLLRGHLAPGSSDEVVVEGAHAEHRLARAGDHLPVRRSYDSNEYCKCSKTPKTLDQSSRSSPPYYDGSVTHVTGSSASPLTSPRRYRHISTASGFAATFPRSRSRCTGSSEDRAGNQRRAGRRPGDSPDPLDVYRARDATNREWRKTGPDDHPFSSSPRVPHQRVGKSFSVFPIDLTRFHCTNVVSRLIAQRHT